MSRRRFLREHDSREISELIAFERAFGLGDGHQTAGVVSAAVAQSFAGAKVSPADFSPVFRPEAAPRGPQTPEEIHARLIGWATGGGTVGA